MTEKTKNLIKEQIEFIPKEAQEVMNTFNWEGMSEEIGKKYLLNEGDRNDLQIEVGLVLVGLEFQELLATNIEQSLNIDKDKAEKISEEADQKIFKPMYNKLTENIKKTLKIRNIHWQQNLNFILSGGDYTAFIERIENEKKDELLKPNESFNPSKLDDLKSKFTI